MTIAPRQFLVIANTGQKIRVTALDARDAVRIARIRWDRNEIWPTEIWTKPVAEER